MDLAVMTEPHLGGTYEELLAAARWTEESGLVGFARSDHLYSGREPRPDASDAFVTLAGLARETSSIELTVLVTPITFRHPAVIAKAATSLYQMSDGRFRLGVGTGWMELEHSALGLPFPPSAERWERFEESLHYLKAAFGEDHARFEGSYYSLDAELRPKAENLPIIIGGSGERRTPRLAGTFADEYNHFTTTPAVLAPKIARVREAAERAGRDPSAIRMSIMGQVFVGSDRSDYQDRLAQAADRRDRSAEEHEATLTEAGVPHGTPDQVHSQLDELSAIGVDLLYVQHGDLADLSPLKEQVSLLT